MIYSDLIEGALTEIKRTQFSKLGIWKGSHLSMEDVQAHQGALAAGARELARWLWKIRAPGGGGGGGGGVLKNGAPPPPPPPPPPKVTP